MSFMRSLFPSKRRRTEAVSVDGGERTEWTDRRVRRGDRRTVSAGDPTLPGTSTQFDRICRLPERELRADSMRLVLVREEDQHVLFDSTTILPLPEDHQVPRRQISQCGRFQLMKRQRDVATISQMLFGAMPAATGTDSFKIHTIPENSKIMVSRMFVLPRCLHRTAAENIPSCDDSSYNSTVRSLDGLRCARSMCITAPPERFNRVRNSSLQEGDGEDEVRAFSPPHRLSKNRRRQLSYRSDLCYEGSAVRWKSRSRLSSCGSSQADEDILKRVGLGVLWEAGERPFLFRHMALIEHEMVRLEGRIEAAATHLPTHFFSLVHQAWRDFLSAVSVLANAPRLRHPVWLSMQEGDELVSRQFCDTLAVLAKQLDTKEKQYFLSNLLSAVLMHHMSWVASVAPPAENTLSIRPSARRNFIIGTAMNDEAVLAPYNVHMAQYLEVVGSVGAASRVARTVVAGNKAAADTVLQVLHVLSYFIRCSSIKQGRADDPSLYRLPVEETFSPLAVSPSDSILASSLPQQTECISPEKDDEDAMSSCSMDSMLTLPRSQRARVASGSPALPIPSHAKRARRGSVDMMAEAHGVINSADKEVDLARSLGRSLLAGPSTSYSPHFVLSGVIKENNNTMVDLMTRMMDEVRSPQVDDLLSPPTSISQSSSESSDGVLPPEKVIVIADTDEWTVKVMSADGMDLVHAPPDAVVSMLEQFVELHSFGLAPKFLISHLEDCLADLLAKSLSLVEMVSGGAASRSASSCAISSFSVHQHGPSTGLLLNGHEGHAGSAPPSSPLSSDRVRSIVGCDHSDLRLILNVAAVYSPGVLASVD